MPQVSCGNIQMKQATLSYCREMILLFMPTQELGPSQIQEELLTSTSDWRILVIHHAQSLSSETEEAFKSLWKKTKHRIVIFDYEGFDYESFRNSDFGRFLLSISEVKRMRTRKRFTLQDLVWAIDKKRTLQALNIVEGLYSQGFLSPKFYSQTLGALARLFSSKYNYIPSILFEMEKNLKRGIFSRSIFEYFIVRLCQRS